MSKDAKIKQVKEILKTLEEIIVDHIEDGGDLDAVTLVDQALEMYKVHMEDEQEQ